MKFLRGRRALLALAIVVLVAAAVAAISALEGKSNAEAIREKIAAIHAGFKSGDPDAQPTYTAHNHGLGSADSAAAEQLAALAYPASSLSVGLLNQESQYYTGTIKGRTKASQNGWQLVGPTTSTQPAVLNFFDNQASDLQVSGRVTAIAVDSNACDTSSCRLWVAAAGGGIWRTGNALASNPSWTFLSGNFGTNAIGTLTFDAASNTLYAGTGEPNASGDSESGVGIYASQNGGTTWTFLQGSAATMRARSISSIAVDPSHPGTLYVSTTRGVRGVSAVTGGAVSLAPDAAPWGLYKTTDGGQSFTEVWNGNGSIRGVNHVELDSHGTVYAAAFQQGVWRSADGGSTWEQVFATQDPGNNSARTEFALNKTSDGHTRIYVGDGGEETGADAYGLPTSNTGVYRADAIDTKTSAQLTGGTNAGYESLTSSDRNNPKWGTYDYCEGQCWYDNYVVSPAGHPDTVYVGGSFDYYLYSFAENGKAVLLSTDAGETWTDQTRDVASPTTGIHPDQHALAVDPANPLLFFEGSDGGVVHSSGQLADGTGTCPQNYGQFTNACKNLLKAVPTKVSTINGGLSTLQFQGISNNGSSIIGGTQDNGTWLGSTGSKSWNQTIYGDGGVPAFDSSVSSWALNEFYGSATDANFENGAPDKWVIVDGTFASSGEASAFYKPQLGDSVVSGTSFVGLQSVWRTQDFGGDKASLEANCPEFTTYTGTTGCGDYAPLGDPTGKGGSGSQSDLTGKHFGSDRQGGYLVALARSSSDHSTLWAATATGRVFISQNADAAAGKVSFTRLDNLSSAAPQRFVSGIAIDPANPNHAWITYTGYNANTPSQPGHVFDVVYNPKSKSATWTDIDNGTGPLGDLPVTGIARDDSTGTLYAATDFTVLASSGNGSWTPAADGMPQVEVANVKVDEATGTLYAGTHGRGIWSLSLH